MAPWAPTCPGFAAEIAALPFALSLLALGMPHGAADAAVLLNERPRRGPGWPRSTAAGYLAIDGAALALLLLLPAVALLAFLPLTVWHFGRTAASRVADEPPRRCFAEAALLVLLPFAFRPGATLSLFDELVRLAGGDAPFPRAVVPLATAACVASAGMLAADLWRERKGRARAAARLALLFLVPALLPPLASVGLLFLLLHAGPECADLGRRLFPGLRGPLRRLARVHLVALPLWLPVLAAVAWLWPLAAERVPSAGPIHAAALFTLLACCVLTPAHEWLRLRVAAPPRTAGSASAEGSRSAAQRPRRPAGLAGPTRPHGIDAAALE
ncbi:Brp/Blh family beta-carotene 15,15'-dioxygenase [Phycisphaera mikurensis]|uniref:Probable beta-carotene 15,15'-dioxygenase n=1 Tax=Phycisphaera mikurensis (strain NBRC 102666 / KCTC 22515 / FYK2301M01) TaxID=1142394 RepID=I0IBG9_PHYMF|nr:Brp/Blh family beta-carotene 15,15'-dioxygenase [Phycisphaera mikurensis]MBB6442861.1 Brp/Blh family beta-carotene 15,15'-monooxygenase [Phycisphaera mikurensis]BAM02607.1 hypothetical protein PSMK_04480 [Phycisphaera mikurensis NBRC 102666]